MKINMPVTDKEVLMKKDTILVTRTDIKGRITYANDAFVEISGFSLDELVGANHNIVRHPDMPAAAFQDLWSTVKSSKPWTGLVKNRTKNGDYYWVEANVTPIFENAKLAGFLSVRYAPKREQILQAETLYQQINANKGSIRPIGMAVKLKKIKEIAIWNKAILVLGGLLALSSWLLYKLFQAQEFFAMAGVVLITLMAGLLGLHLVRLFTRTLEKTIGIFYQLASGKFRNPVDLNRGDQIGDLYRGLQAMQVKLNADLAQIRQDALESSRIRQALDNVESCVMVANNNLDIIYMNETVQKMFEEAEADIRQQLPDFDASKLLGANIDQFHQNPAHQRGMMAKLNKNFHSQLHIGNRYMDISANPVIDKDGERLGIVVEWKDRTGEVNIEHEIENIIASVKAGNLGERIVLTGKDGFFEKLSRDINELTDIIERVFGDMAGSLQSIAAGDLTNKITNDYEGVYASCKNDINASIDKLAEVFGKVREASEFINNSSEEIASGNNNLSQRAEEQASSLEETASSMEELTSTVKNNADNAQQANQVANNARQLAEKGGGVVTQAVEAMQEINDSSNKIAEIIGVIDEIAFQTNLLALNASVEAARAGEQGRGFSVVATEVRNLAQRSATAARESKELIQNSVQKVRAGTEFVNETGASLNEIVTGIKKVGDIVAEIAAASAEQSAGISQVNQAVSSMDEITQQNAALAQQASAASVSMSDQSANLVKLLEFFKTDTASSATGNGHSVTTAAVQTYTPQQRNVSIAKKISASTTSRSTSDDDDWEEF
jgi:methyl-accepting chemotaxis protein